jgi:hypothetical protein
VADHDPSPACCPAEAASGTPLEKQPLQAGILAVIRREERQVEKEVSELQRRLDAIRAAARALGRPGSNGLS